MKSLQRFNKELPSIKDFISKTEIKSYIKGANTKHTRFKMIRTLGNNIRNDIIAMDIASNEHGQLVKKIEKPVALSQVKPGKTL